METFKRAQVNEDAIKRFHEQTRLAAAKDRVIHAALSEAARQIVANYGPNISLDASKDSLVEIRPGIFSGKVEAQLSVDTASGIKRIAYPIEVRASQAILGEDLKVKANIMSALSKVASDLDEKADAYDKAIDEKIASLNQANEDLKQIQSLMEGGMTLEAARSKVFNLNAALKSEASAVSMPDGGNEFNQSNIGINATPQAFIQIEAHRLPGSFTTGDTLDLGGLPYRCLGKEGTFLKFQLIVD